MVSSGMTVLVSLLGGEKIIQDQKLERELSPELLALPLMILLYIPIITLMIKSFMDILMIILLLKLAII
jgi:hypothetical protein